MLNAKFPASHCKWHFVRWASHYLSEKWSKEPFDIGYPILSKDLEAKKSWVFTHLFETKNASGFDIYKQIEGPGKTVEDWMTLDVSESNRYRRLSNERSVHYLHPRLNDAMGLELYQQVFGIKNKYYAKLRWKSMEEDVKAQFDGESAQRMNDERLRIWKGYEIVNYLKRYDNDLMTNPHQISTLYPWEIIKDKLRRKKKPQLFEVDMYDILIKEAFSRNATRKAMHIFYTDIFHSRPQKYTYNRVSTLFNALPAEKREYYSHKQNLRTIQSQKRSLVVNSSFLNYFRQFDFTPHPPHEVGLIAFREWNRLSPTQKEKYRASLSKIQKRELNLDWRTGLVMDYIYYTGQTVNAPEGYNWREDYGNHFRGLTYLNKAYYRLL